MVVESRNFGFLGRHDPLLLACAGRAEVYAFDDPNTSLIKTRQFGEYLSRHVAARHGLDTRGMEFGDVSRMLYEKRLVPRDVRDQFDFIRLRGNEAVHDHRGNQQTALSNLVSAYWLGVWFHRTFADPQFSPGPFRPPAVPAQATMALRDEVEGLRDEAVRYEEELARSRGQAAEFEQLAQQLQADAERYKEESQRLREAMQETQAEHDQSERELERIRQQATRSTPADLESFIERAQRASRSLRMSGEANQCVPITRVRFRLVRTSKCHSAPLLLAQSSKGGLVGAYCNECERFDTVRAADFQSLDVWVSCPRCVSQRLDASMIYGNYAFKCRSCSWSCFLASLLPNWNELFPQR